MGDIFSEKGGVYEWTFKIIHHETSMYIGITSEDRQTDKHLWKNNEGNTYCLSTTGTKVENGCRNSGCGGYHDGDVVQMKLDLNERKLRYELLESSLMTLWKDIGFDNIPCGMNIEYKMAISFTCSEVHT